MTGNDLRNKTDVLTFCHRTSCVISLPKSTVYAARIPISLSPVYGFTGAYTRDLCASVAYMVQKSEGTRTLLRPRRIREGTTTLDVKKMFII
jgi:hypothetical protein